MSSEELYKACQKGDLEKVRDLIDNKKVDPLADDFEAYKWASLCNQRKVCSYLLAWKKSKASDKENPSYR